MQLSNAPGKLTLPFANAGSKNTIPVASQIGITAGAASLTDGFPPLTRTPLAAGGVPPSGLDMNGILFELSAISRWVNAGAGYVYDSTFANDSNVGGYPKGARVQRSDGAGYWLNTIDNNTSDPESFGAGWVPDFVSGSASVAMSGSNVTLTALQAGRPIIAITGTLTANLNLIFPTWASEWLVINGASGSFAVTAKTASGSGVAISTGGAQFIYGDGTNINPYLGNASQPLFVGAATQPNHAVPLSQAQALVSTLPGFIGGLVPSNNGTDANNDIDISSGAATDSTGTYLLKLASTLTKQLDAAWAAGNNAGGMDAGSKAANTWYHIHLIRKDSDGSIDALYSLSPTAPTMPAGYTARRLIGSVRTNGSSNIIAFIAYEIAGGGVKVHWSTNVQDVNVANTLTTTEVLYTLTVPTGYRVTADLRVAIQDAAATIVYVYTPGITTSGFPGFSAITNTSNPTYDQGLIDTNTSAQIAAKTATNTLDSFVVYTMGWTWGRR